MNTDESSAPSPYVNHKYNEASYTACPKCGERIVLDAVVVEMPPQMPQPELMYDLKVASELIPYRPVAHFSAWLNRRKSEFPPRYRTMYMGSRARSTRIRILSMGEIYRIRQQVLSGPGKTSQ